MKKKPRLTKRERKAQNPAPAPRAKAAGGGGGAAGNQRHIHCTACGRHIEPTEFDAPATAELVACEHGTRFASCSGCVGKTKEMLDEHDRTGEPVKPTAAWH